MWYLLALFGVFFIAATYSKTAQNVLLDTLGARMYMSIAGIDALKRREGFRSQTYLDEAGIATIGYGHKLTEGESYPDGIDEDTATALLASDIHEAENSVNSNVTVPLKQSQFDALVSLVYNIGAGAFERSTLLSELNDGNYSGAADQFLVWKKVNGEVSQGLVARRAGERSQFLA